MDAFIYDIPTKVYFGRDNLEYLGDEIIKYGKKVFLIYDGAYVKDLGIYDLIYKESKRCNFEIIEFSEVKPNPRHTDVQKGVDLCKEKVCDVILAVGGGSTIDSAKVIASASLLDAPVWDVVIGKVAVNDSLPLVCISTISATGSEMNCGAVISNLETNDKQSLRRPSQRPKATFLNPEYTYTVNKYQTACGVVDILCHLMESYFTEDKSMYILDSVTEGLIRTVIKYGPIAYNDPRNYEARSNLMWASPWAINDFIRLDKKQGWTMHPIEHEISAYYDITHGLGLAIIMPRFLKYIIDEDSLIRFRNLGIYAFDIDRNLSDIEIAEQVIKKIENLSFNILGLSSSFSKENINGEYFEEIANKLANDNGYFTRGYRKLSKNDILTILNNSL